MNFIFYGVAFCGKKTLIDALICNLHNIDVLEKHTVKYSLKINNNDVEVVVSQSNYHFEINLFEYGLYDKHILSKFIQELASTKNVLDNSSKIIVINRLDKSNKHVQTILKTVIENTDCRFFITTRNFSTIKNDLQSRCCCIRVPVPSPEALLDYCQHHCPDCVLTKEQLATMNLFKINTILAYGHGILTTNNSNLNICFCEIVRCLHSRSHLTTYIGTIRKIIYKMHLLDFSAADIICEFVKEFIQHTEMPSQVLFDIISEAADCQHKSTQLHYLFFCLEKFFAKVYHACLVHSLDLTCLHDRIMQGLQIMDKQENAGARKKRTKRKK